MKVNAAHRQRLRRRDRRPARRQHPDRNYGSASFARARLTGVKTDAFAIDVNADGSKGYYSVFYVQGDEPLQEASTTQGQEPRPGRSELDLRQQHAALQARTRWASDPDTYFAKVVFTGSHENAVLALAQGTVDVAANWWNSDDDSNLTPHAHKGMLKNADGTPMKKDDFRIIMKSALIINSPYAYNSASCRTI